VQQRDEDVVMKLGRQRGWATFVSPNETRDGYEVSRGEFVGYFYVVYHDCSREMRLEL